MYKLFITDSLKEIKAGKAGTFDGELADKAFRVIKAHPYKDMMLGYMYT